MADYAGTSLTIGPHPMSLRRPELALRGVNPGAAALPQPVIARVNGVAAGGGQAAHFVMDEALQARLIAETDVKALKIRHNNVLGYFVEVTAQHGDKLMAPPLNATFIHRQTMANAMRFTTASGMSGRLRRALGGGAGGGRHRSAGGQAPAPLRAWLSRNRSASPP